MDTKEWLHTSTARLEKVGITTARLDCLVLLEDAANKERGWLLANPEYALQGLTLKKLDGWVERRARHEPLAYIRGKSEFYGREFIVSSDTLQPRPETETMIDLLKELIKNSQKNSLFEVGSVSDGRKVKWKVLDVGTGSGCLGITAKLELPEIEVVGTDITFECIKIAKRNAKMLGADVEFYHGDLLQPLPSSIFQLPPSIILANLPYVPNDFPINESAKHEPGLALYGGTDGLDLYRRLFMQVNSLKNKPWYTFTEALPYQHKGLAKIAEAHGYSLLRNNDYVQCFSSL